MVDIASRSSKATSDLVYDIYHIATSVLRLFGKEYRIFAHGEKASTLYGPSISPLMSSTTIRM